MTWLWRMQQLNFLFNIFFQKSISIGICSRSSSHHIFPLMQSSGFWLHLYFVWENLVYLLYWLWCIKASLLRLCSQHHESWHHHLCYKTHKTPPSPLHSSTLFKNEKLCPKIIFMNFTQTPIFQSSSHKFTQIFNVSKLTSPNYSKDHVTQWKHENKLISPNSNFSNLTKFT